MGISVYEFRSMTDEKLWRLAALLRDISKPTLIVAK
jgi:hypothetical protein